MTDYVSKWFISQKCTKMARRLAHLFCAAASLVAGKQLEGHLKSTSHSVFIPVQVSLTLTCVIAGGQAEADAGSKGLTLGIPDSVMQ